ncbi:hypothetical protein YC2023_101366 [Brassica napus]
MQLLDKLVIHGVEPRVISATNINPKLVGGMHGKDNGPCPAVRDGVPFEESPVEDCGPLQRSHEMVELQEIEVKVGVLLDPNTSYISNLESQILEMMEFSIAVDIQIGFTRSE